MTAETSGAPCRAWATSARISARRCSSREASFSRAASSRLPSWPARIVALAARSSLKKSSFESCRKVIAPITSFEDHERYGHQRTGLKLGRSRKGHRLHVIGEDRPALPHCFRGNRTLIGAQPEADETLCELSISPARPPVHRRNGSARNRRRRLERIPGSPGRRSGSVHGRQSAPRLWRQFVREASESLRPTRRQDFVPAE